MSEPHDADFTADHAPTPSSASPPTLAAGLDEPSASVVPAVLVGGRLQLQEELGRGGMGAVLKGWDAELGRELAVKVLLAELQHKPESVQRFLEEAQIAGQLQHPGLAPVYDLGRLPDQRPYFTMKLVKGQTLAWQLAQRRDARTDLPHFLKVFEQICQTLAYAHARRVVHRDLKPANVMVGAFGEVQVMDWGLAKVLVEGAAPPRTAATAASSLSVIRTARRDSVDGSGSSDTQAGSVLGTPAYMPPEQALGEVDRLDERADVFGLGAVLCVILTGQPPYVGANHDVVLRKAVRADLADALARLDACGAEAELVALAKACLGVEPEQRPRHAGAVAEAMTAHLAGVQERLRTAEVARAAATARMTAERKARRVTLTLALVVVGLLAAGGSGWLWVARERDAQQAEAARLAQEQDRHGSEALERARTLRGQLATAPAHDRVALEEQALAAVDRAAGLLRIDAAAALRGPVVALRADLEASKRRRVLLERLDEARFRKADVVRFATLGAYVKAAEAAEAAVDKVYAGIFRELGLDLKKPPSGQALQAEWLRPIHVELALVLDDWAAAKCERAASKPLFALAGQLDPHDPARNKVRTVLAASAATVAGQAPVGRNPTPPADDVSIAKLAQSAEALQLKPATILSVAAALSGMGHPDWAIDLLRRAQRRHPHDYWINHELAERLLREALLLGKAAPDAQQARRIQEQHAKLVDAARFATVAVALRPDGSGARLTLAEILDQQGALAEAVEVLEPVVRHDANYLLAYIRLGNLLQKLGRADEADQRYRQALDKTAADPGEYYALGRSFAALKQWSNAEHALRKAVEREPLFVANYVSFVVTAVEQAETAPAALALAQRAADTLHADRVARYVLGRLLLARARQRTLPRPSEPPADRPPTWLREPALLLLRTACGTPADELDYFARYHSTVLELALGRPGAAVELLAPALRSRPDWFVGHVALAQARARQGRAAEAVGEYRLALSLLAGWTHEAQVQRETSRSTRQENRRPGLWGGSTLIVNRSDLTLIEGHTAGTQALVVTLGGWVHAQSLVDARTAVPCVPRGTALAEVSASSAAASLDLLGSGSAASSAQALASFRHGTWASRQKQSTQTGVTVTTHTSAVTGAAPPLEWQLALTLWRAGQVDAALAALDTVTPTVAVAATAVGAASGGAARMSGNLTMRATRAPFLAAPTARLKLLAHCLLVQGHPAEALTAYRQVVARAGGEREAFALIGKLLEQAGQPNQAQAAYRHIIDAGPDAALGRLVLAEIQRDAWPLPVAAPPDYAAIEAPPGPVAAVVCLRRGEHLLASGAPAAALAQYRDGVRLQPNCAVLHAALGLALSSQGKTDEALAALLKMRRLTEKGNAVLVLKHPARTLRLAPDARAWFTLAELLRARDRDAEARTAELRAIHCDPDDEPIAQWRTLDAARRTVAHALLARGEWNDAARALRAVLRTNPLNDNLRNNLGEAYLRGGKLAEAADVFDEMVATNSAFVPARVNLAQTLLRQGKTAPGDAALRLAVAQDPNPRGKRMRAVLARLPDFLQGTGKPVSAQEQLGCAELLASRWQNQAAASAYAALFAAEPPWADAASEVGPTSNTFRYDAACCAALAGSAEGLDAGSLSEAERARWRRQALAWLRADLDMHAAHLARNTLAARAIVAEHLRHWQGDLDLVGIRAPAALDAMPADERLTWQQLWSEVAALLGQAQLSPER